MLTVCSRNKKECRCDSDNIFKILSHSLHFSFSPHSAWKPFSPPFELRNRVFRIWPWKVKDRKEEKVKILFLPSMGVVGGWGDKIGDRGARNMWVLTLLPLTGVWGDMWMFLWVEDHCSIEVHVGGRRDLAEIFCWDSWRRLTCRTSPTRGCQATE